MRNLINFFEHEYKGEFTYPDIELPRNVVDIFTQAFINHWVVPRQPTNNYSASQIGKNLWLLAWDKFHKNDNMLWSVKKKIFGGFTFECFIAYILEREELQYTFQQDTKLATLTGPVVSGHPDFVVEDSFIIECKELTDSRFRVWQKRGVLLAEYQYAIQLGVYMLSLGIHEGLFIVSNRDTGEVFTEEITGKLATDIVNNSLLKINSVVEFLESLKSFEDAYNKLILPSIPKYNTPPVWMWESKGKLHPIAYHIFDIDSNNKIIGYKK